MCVSIMSVISCHSRLSLFFQFVLPPSHVCTSQVARRCECGAHPMMQSPVLIMNQLDLARWHNKQWWRVSERYVHGHESATCSALAEHDSDRCCAVVIGTTMCMHILPCTSECVISTRFAVSRWWRCLAFQIGACREKDHSLSGICASISITNLSNLPIRDCSFFPLSHLQCLSPKVTHSVPLLRPN